MTLPVPDPEESANPGCIVAGCMGVGAVLVVIVILGIIVALGVLLMLAMM